MQPKLFGKIAWKASDFITSVQMVYGSLGAEGLFTETTAYDPNSPYSASSKFRSFLCLWRNLWFAMTNCSNNYGPTFRKIDSVVY
jgi:dTDP-D-glucose 4,6-dehydratase